MPVESGPAVVPPLREELEAMVVCERLLRVPVVPEVVSAVVAVPIAVTVSPVVDVGLLDVVIPVVVDSPVAVKLTLGADVAEDAEAGISKEPRTIPGVQVTRRVPFHSTLASRLRSARNAPKPDSGEASMTVSHSTVRKKKSVKGFKRA